MMKLRILNPKRFFAVVDGCEGPVCQILPDGSRVDLCRQPGRQAALCDAWRANGGVLPLTVVVPKGRDYLRVVCYYAGDC